MLLRATLSAGAIAALCLLPAPGAANESGCVSSFDATRDYFPDKVESKYGSGFDIRYTGNAKYIRNNISGESYVLYQCGTPMPADAQATPANSLQVGNWTKVAEVPGTRVALDSAAASAALELLGLQDVVAASYERFLVTSPCMQKRLAGLPRIQQSQDAQARRRRNSSSSGRLARRVAYDLAGSDVQWTFTTYGMSDPRSFAVNPESATDLLGKAEWIKFVAAFFNREAEANRVFGDIERSYSATRERLAAQATRRTVGFARYNKVANGTVLGWTVEQPDAWVVSGLADAGMVAHAGPATSFTDTAGFRDATANWDVLVDSSIEPLARGGSTIPQWQDLLAGYGLSDSAGARGAKTLPYLAASSIYRSDLVSSYQNATDYDEHLQLRADLLLEDFGHIAAAPSGTTATTWYRNMPLNVNVNWVSAADCAS
ncbi:hypothetical protein IWQ57_005384 [Coemansia nantahalensis]|uniref:Uncharacterized protein n=2 Tax=Coemansia TaxID=4863 RepID=A0ACC1JN08_9FUNG|nr:hypothetical protein IWQ57_005384 [Coemansia nantahalensis]